MSSEEKIKADMQQKVENLEKEVAGIKNTILHLSKDVDQLKEIIVSELEEYKDFDWEKTVGG